MSNPKCLNIRFHKLIFHNRTTTLVVIENRYSNTDKINIIQINKHNHDNFNRIYPDAIVQAYNLDPIYIEHTLFVKIHKNKDLAL